MNKQISNPIAIGDTICVISRKCSDKVQPKIQNGMLYVVDEVRRLKSGSISLVCHKKTDIKENVSINEERFNFQRVTERDIQAAKNIVYVNYREQLKKAQETRREELIKNSFQHIRNDFTFQEHMKIALVPLVIVELAFEYAMKCKLWCAEHRIGEVKSLSRALVEIRHRYDMFLLKDLQPIAIERLKIEKDKWKEDYDMYKNLMLAEPTISNEMYRQFPDITLLQLRVYATIGLKLIHVYSRHNEKMTKFIHSRVRNGKQIGDSIDNPIVVNALYKCLDAYRGDFEMQETTQTMMIEKIVENSIATSEMGSFI